MRDSKAITAVALGVAAFLAGTALPAQADDGRARYIVAAKPGALAAARAAVAAQGGRVVLDLGEVDAVAVDLPRRAAAALARHGAVKFVEVDHPQYLFAPTVSPSAPPYQTGQREPYGIRMVQADQVSDSLAANRKLCIIDSGIDGAHEDHAGTTLTGENLTTSGDWDTDENGHGTHVAGSVAAVDQLGVGVVGVNPHKKLPLHILKVFDASGSAPSSRIAKAMLRCGRAGANVISMSLGGSVPSQLQQFVVRRLDSQGVLLIAAAGNAGTTAISYPAGFAEVMSVGALDVNKAWATFSQFNADVEISAPGVEVFSTVPMGTGQEATTTVGGTPFSTLPMDGSPNATVTAPLYNFATGEVVDPGAAGKVCLIQRGNISFSDKVLNCQAAGGVGAIIYNNAPGNFNGTLGGVATTIPSVSASQEDGAVMLTKIGQSTQVSVFASNYAFNSGTSMATPHVSAVAALVWSHHLGCTAAQIRESLKLSAEDLGDPGRDDKFGAGLVRAKAAHDRITSLGCGV